MILSLIINLARVLLFLNKIVIFVEGLKSGRAVGI